MKPQAFFAALWLAACCMGLWILLQYQISPGIDGDPPESWPRDCRISREPGRASLLLFAHPQCPCTRSCIDELAWILGRVQGKVQTHVLVIKPQGMPENWEKSDLWHAAAAIPGVQVSVDPEGVLAREFGSQTSGQTLLYDENGRLLFSGGITKARGHHGSNAGRSAVVSLVLEGNGERETPTFGCALFETQTIAGNWLRRFMNSIGGVI